MRILSRFMILLTQQTWGISYFGLWACFWVCLCDMALISEAISHKLAQKGVIFTY